MNFIKLKYWSLLLFFAGCTSSATVVDNTPKQDIFLADPTIFYDDGTYYLYGTGSNKGFLVYSSDDLKNWKVPREATNGLALKRGDAFGTQGFWAPQVFRHNGKFYMAYTANQSIAVAESDNPSGPFTQTLKEPLKAPVRQIDPYIFIDDDGTKYLYHVRVADGGNRIYVAEMKDDFSGIKPETLTECITATQKWENIEDADWFVTEGPTIIKHNDLYYLIYSANHFRSKDYAVGYAVSENPTGPWRKFEGNPILRREDINKNGTGHGDIFFDENENMYYVFHTHNSDTAVGPRRTAIVEADFHQGEQEDILVLKEDSFYFLQAETEKGE